MARRCSRDLWTGLSRPGAGLWARGLLLMRCWSAQLSSRIQIICRGLDVDSFVKETLVEPLELSPTEIIGALVAMSSERRAAILDSGGNREPDARFLIAGFDPFETVDAGLFSLTISRRDGAKLTSSEPFLKYLDARLSELALPRASSGTDLPACGICLVTLNYEFVHALEHLHGG